MEKRLKIRFLGTGGAFDYEYGNSAALLTIGGKTLLLDSGFTVYSTLRSKDLISSIDCILLTHLHNDHCGSLATILTHFNLYLPDKRLTLLYPNQEAKEELYQFLKLQVKNPGKYADFQPLQEALPQAEPVDTYGKHSENFRTFAYIFEEDGCRIAYSGDLAEPEALFDVLKKKPEMETTVFHDITFEEKNTGHTYYTKLLPYHRRYQIYGYHCDPSTSPKDNPIELVYNHPSLLV